MSVLRTGHLQLPFLLPRLSYRSGTHALHTFGPSSSPDTNSKPARPNRPLDLDPALQALLNDVDLSLMRANSKSRAKRKSQQSSSSHDTFTPAPRRELEVLETIADVESEEKSWVEPDQEDMEGPFPSTERKSPAASFGSRSIGAVVLPFELQRSILRLISGMWILSGHCLCLIFLLDHIESEKPLIHADAERLFRKSPTSESKAEEDWSTRYTPPSWSTSYSPPSYTEVRSTSKISHIKARLNRQRDGTAFASVVMPAQYAVVRAVLEIVKTRLGDEWTRRVDRVVEWGSGTGAGMWYVSLM